MDKLNPLVPESKIKDFESIKKILAEYKKAKNEERDKVYSYMCGKKKSSIRRKRKKENYLKVLAFFRGIYSRNDLHT